MTRTVDAALIGAISKTVTAPRYYIKFGSPLNVRYTTGSSVTYNLELYSSADVSVGRFSWRRGALQSVKIRFQAIDSFFTALFLNNDTTNVTVDVFYSDAADEANAVQLLSGAIDDFYVEGSEKAGYLELTISQRKQYAPADFVNAASGFTELDPPGQYIFPNGRVDITRNDGRYL